MTYDVEAALAALGISADIHGEEACALCPMHEQRTGKEDHSPSWWINLETGYHVCFSCGYKGGLVQLVCDVKDFYVDLWGTKAANFDAARLFLAETAQLTVEQMTMLLLALPSYIPPKAKLLEMSEARLAIYVDPPKEELDKRKITAESAAAYGILWEEKRKNWILPLREPDLNKLMGWQEKGTVQRTFMNRPAGLQKSKTLFGVSGQQEDVVVLVESPLDCPRILDATGIHAVASCGATVSEAQVKLLRFSGKIVIALDNPAVDAAGKKASKEMLDWGRKYGLNLFFFNYGDSGAKDPGDMTDEQIRWGIDNAVSSLYGEAAYVSQ
jgi:DNA primase